MPDPSTSSAAPLDGSFGPDATGSRRARVLLPLPLGGAYDYRIPEGMAVQPGNFVQVPLGSRSVPAVVWDPAESAEEPVAEARLRPIGELYDTPSMTPPLRRLIDWIAAYTLAPPGAVLRMAMGSIEALNPATAHRGYVAAEIDPSVRLTSARRRILDVLTDGLPRPAAALALEAGCSAGVVRGMADAGLLTEVKIAARPRRPIPDWRLPFPTLSADQEAAAAAVTEALRLPRYECFLLDGVTG
ncbi:MAG: primosomal protein N', partial [Aliidongia sp.]